MPLDELVKRKDNFDEANSVRLTLADGQEWAIPKPWLEIRPAFRDGKAVNNYPVFTYGPELEALVEAIASAEGELERLCGIATLAAYLLQKQYDLHDEDLDQLLAFRHGDPDSAEWATRIIQIATGRSGPKAACAGGG
jgi:hypothetical protein